MGAGGSKMKGLTNCTAQKYPSEEPRDVALGMLLIAVTLTRVRGDVYFRRLGLANAGPSRTVPSSSIPCARQRHRSPLLFVLSSSLHARLTGQPYSACAPRAGSSLWTTYAERGMHRPPELSFAPGEMIWFTQRDALHYPLQSLSHLRMWMICAYWEP